MRQLLQKNNQRIQCKSTPLKSRFYYLFEEAYKIYRIKKLINAKLELKIESKIQCLKNA